MKWSTEAGDFSRIFSSNQLECLMESSSTSSCNSTKSKKLSTGLRIRREALVTISTIKISCVLLDKSKAVLGDYIELPSKTSNDQDK